MKLAHIGESKFMHWSLIITFIILWFIVATVSTLHAITFFTITNTLALAIFLGIAYEIGQAAVLFSILMTKNREKFLPWALMILLTSLQVTANVYASFKYMSTSGSEDWVFWQKSILFGVQATSPEMYQIIISWISGALLPIVALGMTALVAQNIRMMAEEEEKKGDTLNEKIIPENSYFEAEVPKSKKDQEHLVREEGTIKNDNIVYQNGPELTREDTEKLDPYLQGGVEVIDAKAIQS